MNDLKVDYLMLQQKMNDLFKVYGRIGEELSRISDLTAYLDIFWDGDANERFVAAISRDLLRMSATLVRIRHTIGMLRRAFDVYERNEKEIRMIFDSSGIGR